MRSRTIDCVAASRASASVAGAPIVEALLRPSNGESRSSSPSRRTDSATRSNASSTRAASTRERSAASSTPRRAGRRAACERAPRSSGRWVVTGQPGWECSQPCWESGPRVPEVAGSRASSARRRVPPYRPVRQFHPRRDRLWRGLERRVQDRRRRPHKGRRDEAAERRALDRRPVEGDREPAPRRRTSA